MSVLRLWKQSPAFLPLLSVSAKETGTVLKCGKTRDWQFWIPLQPQRTKMGWFAAWLNDYKARTWVGRMVQQGPRCGFLGHTANSEPKESDAVPGSINREVRRELISALQKRALLGCGAKRIRGSSK